MAAPKASFADRYFALEPGLITALLTLSGGLGLYLGVFLAQFALTGQVVDPLGDLIYPLH